MTHRRQFSPEFKAQVVLEVVSGAKSADEICREHQLKPELFSKWKAQFLREAATIFGVQTSSIPRRHGSRNSSEWSGASRSNWKWQKKPGHA